MGGCRWKRGEKQRSRQGTVHQSHRSQGLDGDRETQGLWDPLESEVPQGQTLIWGGTPKFRVFFR